MDEQQKRDELIQEILPELMQLTDEVALAAVRYVKLTTAYGVAFKAAIREATLPGDELPPKDKFMRIQNTGKGRKITIKNDFDILTTAHTCACHFFPHDLTDKVCRCFYVVSLFLVAQNRHKFTVRRDYSSGSKAGNLHLFQSWQIKPYRSTAKPVRDIEAN